MKKITRRLFLFIVKLLLAFFLLSISWVLTYKYIAPPISGMMLYKFLTIEDYSYCYEWIEIENINRSLPLALIASEDQLFLEHNGFDISAIQKAIKHNKEHKQKRGASTISQQLAKNVFLFPTKSFFRKGLEAYFTLLVELFWSKKRIMEVYLNVIELGNGIFGIQAASKEFYKTQPKSLSWNQSAMISTSLPNPIVLQLNKPSDYMYKRRSWVLKQMNNLGGERIISKWYE